MKATGVFAFALLTMLGLGDAVIAQPTQNAGQSSTPNVTPERHDGRDKQGAAPSAEDRAAFLDARIAAIHAGLKLTPDQEKLWPPAESAARDMARSMAALHDKVRAEGKLGDPLAAIRRKADMAISRGEAMKKIADAAAPLYATLTPEQKNRLSHLMHMSKRERMHSWMTGHDKSDHEIFGSGKGDYKDMSDHGGRR